jgi:peptidoglycan/xylan/chitin deacetylase (PgdA/CDA1 family)
VALSYVAYRGIAIVGSSGMGSLFAPQAAAIQIGCREDEHTTHTSANKDVSGDFQRFLSEQTPKSENLLPNTSLTALDRDTRSPQSYYRTVETPQLNYSLAYDDQNEPYLHLTSIAASDIGGAWVTDSTPLKPGGTYAYAFSYRASTAASVTAEYVMSDNTKLFETVAHLERAEQWQSFTNYLDNVRNAKSFRFIVTLSGPGQLDTRDFSVRQLADASLNEGIVSVTFDDGWQSAVEKALPLLQKYHLRTTQYIITTASDNSLDGYMSDRTIRRLKDLGHEVGSHTLLHCDLTKLSNEEIIENADASKRHLEEKKLGPIVSFAYPYGAYNKQTQRILAPVYPLIRTSDEGYNDRYFDAKQIRSVAIRSTTTDQEFKAMLDHTKQHKLWLVLVYHRVDERGDYSVTSRALNNQLRLLHESRLRAVPLGEAAKMIRPKAF